MFARFVFACVDNGVVTLFNQTSTHKQTCRFECTQIKYYLKMHIIMVVVLQMLLLLLLLFSCWYYVRSQTNTTIERVVISQGLAVLTCMTLHPVKVVRVDSNHVTKSEVRRTFQHISTATPARITQYVHVCT